MATATIQYLGTGRRKEAVARVRLIAGTGKIVINKREFEAYLPLKTLQMVVAQPFNTAGVVGKYDVLVNVYGGGTAGQAGAIRHGIARALLKVDPTFRIPLKRAGLLTRDPRAKERRKYGLKKARKRPQFSKR